MNQTSKPFALRSRHAFRPGDHVRVWRGVYWHHAIFVGNGQLIEFGGGVWGGPVAYVAWRAFARGGRVQRVRHAESYPPSEVVSRAESCLGRTGFSLLGRNCEHFANWCATGRAESRQSQFACGVLAALALGVIASQAPAGRVRAA